MGPPPGVLNLRPCQCHARSASRRTGFPDRLLSGAGALDLTAAVTGHLTFEAGEKVESAFSPEDRIGALEMQTLAVGDNRALILHHLSTLRKLAGGEGAMPALPIGEE